MVSRLPPGEAAKRRKERHDKANRNYRRSSIGRAKQKLYMDKTSLERQLYIDRIKLERGCADCGYKGHPAALDFDHRDPAQKINGISQLTQIPTPWKRLLSEIDKCDVVCARCHRIRSASNNRIITSLITDSNGTRRQFINNPNRNRTNQQLNMFI